MLEKTTCDVCQKKIGILSEKYYHNNSNDKNLIYCSECDDKWQEKNEIKEEKRAEQERKISETKMKNEEKIKREKILSKNNQWEYKILNLNTVGSGFTATGNKIKEDFLKEFNSLGLDRWELVAATPMISIAARLGASGTATEWVSCIFKRRI